MDINIKKGIYIVRENINIVRASVKSPLSEGSSECCVKGATKNKGWYCEGAAVTRSESLDKSRSTSRAELARSSESTEVE